MPHISAATPVLRLVPHIDVLGGGRGFHVLSILLLHFFYIVVVILHTCLRTRAAVARASERKQKFCVIRK